MWFKNLRIYRFTAPFSLSADDLDTQLADGAFVPCGSQDLSRVGWVSPLGGDSEQLVHASQGYLMVCAKKQEKVLPAAVVNEALDEKVAEIAEKEGRPVGRKERSELKDDVILALLPKAFVRSSLQYAYIAPEQGYIVVNAASANKAESMLSLLREALGSLPVHPLVSKHLPHQVMTRWVADGIDTQHFTLGGECELSDPKESTSVIRCKHQDLSSPEIKNHLEAGMVVTKLALCGLQGVEFVLDDQVALKRLKFADEIHEKADAVDAESKVEQFDIEFSVMTLELTAIIAQLLEALGGINTQTDSVDSIVAQATKADTGFSGVDEVVLA